jgi:UDP-glucose 4-epimerase
LRILVTGGAGFIGSNVADRYVSLGHEVTVFDDLSTGKKEFVHPKARLVVGDLTQADALERCIADFKPEVVNHHAAQIDVRKSVSDPVHDATTNIIGGIRMLESSVRHRVRKVIYASTGGALYGEARFLPATEEHPVNPEAPYGASKHTLEHYLYIWRLLHCLDYTVLRYPNVYGPRQNPHGEAGVVAIFSELLLAGAPCNIYGSGLQKRDFVFVADVARANRLALDAEYSGPLNIGTGVETDIVTLHRLLAEIAGVGAAPRHLAAKPGEQQRSSIDASLAGRVLGWRAQVALREGLEATLEFFRHRRASRRAAA